VQEENGEEGRISPSSSRRPGRSPNESTFKPYAPSTTISTASVQRKTRRLRDSLLESASWSTARKSTSMLTTSDQHNSTSGGGCLCFGGGCESECLGCKIMPARRLKYIQTISQPRQIRAINNLLRGVARIVRCSDPPQNEAGACSLLGDWFPLSKLGVFCPHRLTVALFFLLALPTRHLFTRTRWARGELLLRKCSVHFAAVPFLLPRAVSSPRTNPFLLSYEDVPRLRVHKPHDPLGPLIAPPAARTHPRSTVHVLRMPSARLPRALVREKSSLSVNLRQKNVA
jgi:hypothetical protein